MSIYFVEIEETEREFFEQALPDHDIAFVSQLTDVPDDAEIVCVFLND